VGLGESRAGYQTDRPARRQPLTRTLDSCGGGCADCLKSAQFVGTESIRIARHIDCQIDCHNRRPADCDIDPRAADTDADAPSHGDADPSHGDADCDIDPRAADTDADTDAGTDPPSHESADRSSRRRQPGPDRRR
jgi:hypothetical protein